MANLFTYSLPYVHEILSWESEWEYYDSFLTRYHSYYIINTRIYIQMYKDYTKYAFKGTVFEGEGLDEFVLIKI